LLFLIGERGRLFMQWLPHW